MGGVRIGLAAAWLLAPLGCSRPEVPPGPRAAPPGAPAASPAAGAPTPGEEKYRAERDRLLDELREMGVRDPAVLAAVERVPRHRFVPESLRDEAYGNYPLPIGHGQTISQPYIVAVMTEAARLAPGANVLEVGTGSGYQAAVLAEVLGLGPQARRGTGRGRLASIEIVPELAERAEKLLRELGYADLAFRVGDGYRGWPERAPFDAILVTAAPDHVPEPLTRQLAAGGRLVIPVGRGDQELLVVTRTPEGLKEERLLPVRFVPMTGEAEGGR